MKQKTAMQCAIELIEQYIDGKITMAELSNEFKVELLEKEKEQIMGGYNKGMYSSLQFSKTPEQYYNETYKQD